MASGLIAGALCRKNGAALGWHGQWQARFMAAQATADLIAEGGVLANPVLIQRDLGFGRILQCDAWHHTRRSRQDGRHDDRHEHMPDQANERCKWGEGTLFADRVERSMAHGMFVLAQLKRL